MKTSALRYKPLACYFSLMLLAVLFFHASASPKNSLFYQLRVLPAEDLSSQPSAIPMEGLSRQMGALEKSAQASGTQQVAFQGDTIVVDAEELRVLTEKKKLIGKTNAEELAVQSLLKREALYQLAVAAGYKAADEDVLAKIAQMKAVYENPDTMGREDITAWAEGAGMTPDEYLNSLYDQYKKELTTNLYTAPIYEAYAEERGIVQWSYAEYEPWQEYLLQIANKYIAQDHVVDNR